MPVEPSEIKGVWMVTAKGYVLDRHGRAALDEIADLVQPTLRHGVLEPLPSVWYPEELLQQAMAAMKTIIAKDSDEELQRALERCTELGVSRFFRALLRLSSAEFVLAQVPTMWRHIRHGPGRVSVERSGENRVLHYTSFPYFDDVNYRLLTVGSLGAVLRLCTRDAPRVTLGAHGKDHLDVLIQPRSRSMRP